MADDLFTTRKNLAEICTVPDKIISVYSLEKHVWADSNSEASRNARKSELQTIEEFQIDPVRPFLTDIAPLSGRMVPEFPRKDIRELREGVYRIVYQVFADSLVILTVFEGHRLLPTKAFDHRLPSKFRASLLFTWRAHSKPRRTPRGAERGNS